MEGGAIFTVDVMISQTVFFFFFFCRYEFCVDDLFLVFVLPVDIRGLSILLRWCVLLFLFRTDRMVFGASAASSQ